MKRHLLAMCALVGLLLQNALILPSFASAQEWDQGFDPNQILQDDDIFDVKGMSLERLQGFLASKGTLGSYRTVDIDGVPKTAAEIIWRVANTYKINPKYLLALIQKEQSLVEDPDPSQSQFDWATGYAVCDSCAKDDPSIQEFKGFASQIEWAAKQHREKYLLQLLSNGQTRSGKAPGKPMTIDGEVVTPVNNATAMLYTYTPHIRGNYNLWRIWRRWFSLRYPDGTVVKANPSGDFFLISNGVKREFVSKAVLESLYDPTKVVEISDTELATYLDGAPIKFPKYALLKDPAGRIWLLTGSERSHIANMAAFRKFGFNEDEVEDVDDADLAGYPIGEGITIKTEFPQGTVMLDKAAKTYWYVEDGVRHKISDKVLLKVYFRGRNVRNVTSDKLKTYEEGSPFQLNDGELVRSTTEPAVFIKENGILRPIASAEVFETMGWKWNNVVTVQKATLKEYEIGDPFVLEAMPPATAGTTEQIADSQ